ncbi:hypothetical protein PCE1_002555 [Barthelona sp. PCE]
MPSRGEHPLVKCFKSGGSSFKSSSSGSKFGKKSDSKFGKKSGSKFGSKSSGSKFGSKSKFGNKSKFGKKDEDDEKGSSKFGKSKFGKSKSKFGKDSKSKFGSKLGSSEKTIVQKTLTITVPDLAQTREFAAPKFDAITVPDQRIPISTDADRFVKGPRRQRHRFSDNPNLIKINQTPVKKNQKLNDMFISRRSLKNLMVTPQVIKTTKRNMGASDMGRSAFHSALFNSPMRSSITQTPVGQQSPDILTASMLESQTKTPESMIGQTILMETAHTPRDTVMRTVPDYGTPESIRASGMMPASLNMPRMPDGFLELGNLNSNVELKELSLTEARHVEGFELSNKFGSIEWQEPVNLMDDNDCWLPLSDIVYIVEHNAEIDTETDYNIDGLLKPAIITLHDIIPQDMSGLSDIEKHTVLNGLESHLKELCEENGADFIDYDRKNYIWKFYVNEW